MKTPSKAPAAHSAQFTPGPWRVESGWTIVHRTAVRAPFIVAKVENCFIAQYCAAHHFSPETTKANAQLIAAAPALLDACEAAEFWLRREQEAGGLQVQPVAMLRQLRGAIRAAGGDAS